MKILSNLAWTGRARGSQPVVWAAVVAAACLIPRSLPAGESHPWISAYQDATTCTKCHDTAATEIMQTTHWTWQHTEKDTGRLIGKRTVINNFCVALPSNEPRCTSCHIGVGYQDKSFDFADASKVDCLVCHDTTGTYKKFPTLAGAPWTGPGATNFGGVVYEPVDLAKVARNVGKTSRATCGACHFYGGGGDGVKHGDLDSSLMNPSRDLDVHMGGALNFQCADCHRPMQHVIPGSIYSQDQVVSQSCEKCHTATPHKAGDQAARLNLHAERVACQTCHIPRFARGRTTKMSWDWSTAGKKDASGKNYVTKDANGDPTYDTQKGNFTWQRDVVPQYRWSNGQVDSTTVDDLIDPTGLVSLNRLHGDLTDLKARIVPVKQFVGRQPYDPVNRVMAVPHLFGADTNAYWKGFNWTNALQFGMDYVSEPFSGQVGWVATEMYWVQNHQVAPKEKALQCADCHSPKGQLSFASLGYGEQAAHLQTLAGFELSSLKLNVNLDRIELRWQAGPGYNYQVESSVDMRAWTSVADGQFTGGVAMEEKKWETDLAGAANRFYRVKRTNQ